MKNAIVSLIIIVSLQVVYGQSGWFWQNPQPTGTQLEDIYFVNENVGYAVGWDGIVLKTTNGGINWIQYDSELNYFLMSVFFINESTGYVVAGSYNYWPPNGAILKTTNGGLNWNKTVYNGISLNSVYFIDNNTGFASGIYYDDYGILFKTTNAGQNWTQVNNLPSTFYLSSIQFLNDHTGFISDDQQVIKTTNQGENWTVTGFGVLNGLLDICFTSIDTGYASGYYGRIYKTTNSGTNWILIGNDPSTHLRSIKFKDSNTGFVAGANKTNNYPGKVKRTTNGGLTWDSLYYGNNANLMEVSFINSDQIIVVGKWGTISRSTNLGNNWNVITESISGSSLRKIEFTNNGQGYIVGASNAIFKTTNYGINWLPQNLGISANYNDIEVLDNNHIIIICNDGRIVKTTNGGGNWSVINYFSHLFSVDFVNISTGYVLSDVYIYPPGLYYCGLSKTTDFGNTWVTKLNGVDYLGSCYFINENTGFVSRFILNQQVWQILKTINGAQSFYQISLPNNTFANCFYFLNELTGFAGGTLPLLKTTNCGDNWFVVNFALPFSYTINSIYFTNSNTGYICCTSSHDYGEGGNILKTTDGGNNWYHFTSLSTYPTFRVGLNSIVFLNESTGLIVGNNGTILKTTNGGGIIGIDEKIKSLIHNSLSLHQNYPNPFNPATKIKFEIPLSRGVSGEAGRGVLVKIVVYDLLGREVATLVNEQLKPGTYEVDWDGSNYASGVYFYSLITNGFKETKRMVIIK